MMLSNSHSFLHKYRKALFSAIGLLGSGVLLCVSGVVGKPQQPSLSTLDSPAQQARIGALGRLEPLSRIHRISAPPTAQGGCLGQLYVAEGDKVTTGQLLAALDSLPQYKAEVEQAKAQCATARARLAQLLAGTDPHRLQSMEAELKEARLTADQYKRDQDRYLELSRTQTVANSDREDRENRYARAVQTVRRLEALLEEASRVRPEDVDVRRAEVTEATASLAAAEARLAMAEIRSPVEGTVLRIHTRAGERPSADGILEVGDVSRMVAVAEVYEADVSKVRLGAAASVVVKATGIQAAGVVIDVGRVIGRKVALDNDPVTDADARIVEVRLLLLPPYPEVLCGMSNARVEVVIQSDAPQPRQ